MRFIVSVLSFVIGTAVAIAGAGHTPSDVSPTAKTAASAGVRTLELHGGLHAPRGRTARLR